MPNSSAIESMVKLMRAFRTHTHTDKERERGREKDSGRVAVRFGIEIGIEGSE